MPPPPFAVWSEILAADNGLTLTSFAVGGATMNTLPGPPTVDAGYELTAFDSVNPVITQPAAAVIQLGSNGEGRGARLSGERGAAWGMGGPGGVGGCLVRGFLPGIVGWGAWGQVGGLGCR